MCLIAKLLDFFLSAVPLVSYGHRVGVCHSPLISAPCANHPVHKSTKYEINNVRLGYG